MDAHQTVSQQLSARTQNSSTSSDSPGSPPDGKPTVTATIFKGPKRKRLVKVYAPYNVLVYSQIRTCRINFLRFVLFRRAMLATRANVVAMEQVWEQSFS